MALTEQPEEETVNTISSTAASLLNRRFYDFILSGESNLKPLTDENHNVCEVSPTQVPTYSMKEVSEHSSYDSCWLVIRDKVYDVTQFLHKHPGGMDIILEHAGRDATHTFDDKGHSSMAYTALAQYYIGELIEKDKIEK